MVDRQEKRPPHKAPHKAGSWREVGTHLLKALKPNVATVGSKLQIPEGLREKFKPHPTHGSGGTPCGWV